ncbi:DUF3820 family protein [Siphonobacter curvatus]|uniref:Cytoplasmic protein n=1 Tax=Siphonobacter curvatus TaxID=2094562 RepID=A0A2S7IP91_9BACT|nr:DUF3820 family protein [Siphonobacter curvatus]PQA59502.1 hypothetical protein C5O19_07600 [Siphonobacter curvatus]
MEESPQLNPQLFQQLLTYRMPYGKHKGQLLRQLPISYLEWFARKGFPEGKLGLLLRSFYEIKLNGLEYLLNEAEAFRQ